MSADSDLNKPSWNDAPKTAMFLAQDENGAWGWFDSEPLPSIFRRWLAPLWTKRTHAGTSKINIQWRNTLEKRPQK